MQVSVVLCTYNRAESLSRALESIAASRMPAGIDWQVLIVDNNSKDATRLAADEFCRRDPAHFHYIFEPKQGKSFALNRGIREAHGDIVAFVDDDVVVEPDWLVELTKPLANRDWAGTGGRVYLPGDFSPPPWMAVEGDHSLIGILAQFDLGSEVCELTRPPVGNNMAFRKEMFSKYGGFRTDLGPTPGSQIRYEDTEFGSRVMSGGERILYVPTAIVRHDIEEGRLTKKYFLAYHFDYGRALIREKGRRKPVGMIPRYFISISNRCLSILPRRAWQWLRERDPRKRFCYKCNVWTIAGEIAEIWHRSYSKDSPHSSSRVSS
jgi:glycosyltransferase involved in cell wall biosynthesis